MKGTAITSRVGGWQEKVISTLSIFLLLGIGICTFKPAAAQETPSVAGTWRATNIKKTLVLTQTGSTLQGRLENDGWSNPVEGTVSPTGAVALREYFRRELNPNIPEDVWLHVLRSKGSTKYPGALGCEMQLQFQQANDMLTGTRETLSVTYDRAPPHLVDRVFGTSNPITLTRKTKQPDVEVTDFTSVDDRFNDTAAKKIWNIRATIRNSSTTNMQKAFRVRLESGHLKPTDREPVFTPVSPWIEIPALFFNISSVAVWTTGDPAGAGGNYSARFTPPQETLNFAALRVVADFEKVVEESSEDNNEKTLWRLDAAPCARGAWTEIPNPENDTAVATDKFRQWRIDSGNPAEAVLCYIKMEAQRRAKRGAGSVVKSNMAKALSTHFLKDYLAGPSKDAADDAINVIGANMGFPLPDVKIPYILPSGLPGRRGALWVPKALRDRYPQLPAWLIPATQFWVVHTKDFKFTGDNVTHLRVLDVPFLVGGDNLGTGVDEDVSGGGRNLSNVMHWATGVKYGNLPKDGLRTLFIGYELWHLEGWDTFSEDPLNDLISEEQGRMLGARLRHGGVASEGELVYALDEDFKEARAWVGALLRERREKLDEAILADTPTKSNFWWGYGGIRARYSPPWGRGDTPVKSIKQSLTDGMSVEEVIQTGLVERLIQIYTLIYEVEEWERRTQKSVQLTDMMRRTVKGDYDTQFQSVSKDNDAQWEWRP